MNDVRILSSLIQHRTEGVQHYSFICTRDRQPLIPNSKYSYQANLANGESLVKTVPMKVNGNELSFDSTQVLDLPAGVYRLELWEVIDDVVHGIYPSDRDLKFTVQENVLDLPTGKVSSLTLDEFEKQFKELAEKYRPGTSGDGGKVIMPHFKVGNVNTVDSDQPATVEMVTNDDGDTVINYNIPRGRDGKDGQTWKPYINHDGYWHIKADINPEIN